MVGARPHVSVCIPVYRSERWIGGAIESVLAQTYGDFEVVVVDNQSPDATADVVLGFDDERVRLHVNPSNLGPVVNHNRAIQHARGDLIKVLHADDRLLPRCLERMVELLDPNEGVGFVFGRRRIELDPGAESDLVWYRESLAELHRGFGGLGRVNDGRRLFDAYMRAGFPWNWVGEQTAAMIRRSCLERLGLFNVRIWQLADMEMWARLMLAYDVGFIDDELVVYRFGHDNLTAENARFDRHWIDRLWLFETLLAQDPAPGRRSALAHLRKSEYLYVGRQMGRAVLSRAHLAPRLRDLRDYGAYRIRRAAGSRPPLVPELSAGADITIGLVNGNMGESK